MLCSICDTSLPEDAEFCLRCGAPTKIHFTVSSARQVQPIPNGIDQETIVRTKKRKAADNKSRKKKPLSYLEKKLQPAVNQ